MVTTNAEFTLKLSLDEVVALQKYLGVSSKDVRREAGLSTSQSTFIDTLFDGLCDLTDPIKMIMDGHTK